MDEDATTGGTAGMARSGWGHLNGGDSRTPEERQAAEAKEWRRRRGGNRNWWKGEQDAPGGR